jgi:hypothetical protein
MAAIGGSQILRYVSAPDASGRDFDLRQVGQRDVADLPAIAIRSALDDEIERVEFADAQELAEREADQRIKQGIALRRQAKHAVHFDQASKAPWTGWDRT